MVSMLSSFNVAFAVEAVVPVEAFDVECGSPAPRARFLGSGLLSVPERWLRQELDGELEFVIKLIGELNFKAHSVRGEGW